MTSRLLSLALTLGIALGITPRSAAAPTVAEIERVQVEAGAPAAHWLRQQDLSDPDVALDRIIKELDARARGTSFNAMETGLRLCTKAAQYGRHHQDRDIRRAAATLADAFLHKYVTPSGAFVQVDRATWLTPATVWLTIPWGVPFNGNAAFETWTVLKDDFTPEQRAFWQKELEKTGRWIQHNPIVGGYVFNAMIDLCRLHWRLGREFNHPEWTSWALEAAKYRIDRDLDDEGWIQGESGGASPGYQLFGSHFLALFAWESKAPFLIEAVKRVSSRCYARYATPTMAWAGNFGTRSNSLGKLPGDFLLVAAALGDPSAAYFVQTYAETGWSADVALWQAALTHPKAPAPTPVAVTTFKGIASTVVREGPWVAYFGNYDRSLWSHGFANLWHAGHEDWIFSTLQSLPTNVEKAKLRLGDTSDWSGFPHVRVIAGDTHYDSHQRIDSLETKTGDGVTVTWSEPLRDPKRKPGGVLRSTYRFHGREIEMNLDLRDLAGESQLDFHFMRRPNGYVLLWAGKDLDEIMAGRFVRNPGFQKTREFKPGTSNRFGVQMERTLFVIETIELPAAAKVSFQGQTDDGLHTGNFGGFRFRIAAPATEKSFAVKLRLRSLE